MQALPSGTVTFVFTDIEGSTELLKQLGSSYGDVLADTPANRPRDLRRGERDRDRHAGRCLLLRVPASTRRGRGRGRGAASARGRTSGRKALSSESGWASTPASPRSVEEGYLGLDVVRAARICTVARGGNVLALGVDAGAAGLDPARWRVGVPPRRAALEGHRRAGAGLRARDRRRGERGAGRGGRDVDAPRRRSARCAGTGRARPRDGQFESFGTELAASIQERVLGSLERSLGKHGTPSTTLAAEDADVDDLAARSSALEEQIRARVEAALKAKGISPDESYSEAGERAPAWPLRRRDDLVDQFADSSCASSGVASHGSTRIRASTPRRSASARSESTRSSAFDNAAGSSGGTRSPVSPSATTSGIHRLGFRQPRGRGNPPR